jgi:hypothetical protein
MANIRHFATVGGETVRFDRVDYRSNGKFGWHAPSNTWIKVERSIEYKAFASKHECDARCINATGRIMKCECSCGGKNHGNGAFNCTSEAA